MAIRLLNPGLLRSSNMPDKNKKFIVVISLCITGRARRGGLILKKKGLVGIVLRRF